MVNNMVFFVIATEFKFLNKNPDSQAGLLRFQGCRVGGFGVSWGIWGSGL